MEDHRRVPVQALLSESSSLRTIPLPKEYVQPCQVQRDGNTEPVPVLDLSKLLSFDKRTKIEALKRLDQACTEWGAFQLINHGIPSKVLDGMKRAAVNFYKVPVLDKMKYFVTDFDARPMRYSTSFDARQDTVLGWRDVLRIPAEPRDDENGPYYWPDEEHLPRGPVKEYGQWVEVTVSALLQSMSEGLGLPQNFLNQVLVNMDKIMSINFYPPCPEPDKVLGLGSHTDATAITVILQNEVDGLQLFHDTNWADVAMLPNGILVNLGDQMQILSNGRYKSVEHRAVVNEHKLRVSIATLCAPSKAASIQPASQLVDEEHPALYRPVVFQDYLLHYIKKGLNTRAGLKHLETGSEHH